MSLKYFIYIPTQQAAICLAQFCILCLFQWNISDLFQEIPEGKGAIRLGIEYNNTTNATANKQTSGFSFVKLVLYFHF